MHETLLDSVHNSALTVSTLVSFASKWLLPRLASFQFYLVTPVETAHSKKVEAFRAWLIDSTREANTPDTLSLD